MYLLDLVNPCVEKLISPHRQGGGEREREDIVCFGSQTVCPIQRIGACQGGTGQRDEASGGEERR